MTQYRARSLQQQPQSQLAAWCVDCEVCADRERRGRRERRGSDREGRGAEVAQVAVGEVGLKLRAWRRGSSCSSALYCGVRCSSRCSYCYCLSY
jgi:hypothetical protein